MPDEVDGHDVKALRDLLTNVPFDENRPGALICHTVKGKGIPSIEGNAAWHHRSRLGEEDLNMLIRELDEMR